MCASVGAVAPNLLNLLGLHAAPRYLFRTIGCKLGAAAIAAIFLTGCAGRPEISPLDESAHYKAYFNECMTQLWRAKISRVNGVPDLVICEKMATARVRGL